MRIAVSNIAWDPEEDEQAASLFKGYRVDAIDVAPGKYFPDVAKATGEDIAKVRAWWEERDIKITGMQALLFGKPEFNLFGPPEVQRNMLEHLDHVCRIGAGLGATWLVFGSPKNRDRTGLDDTPAEEMAVDFFRRLGDVAASHEVVVCLEANPPVYGCNFMTTTREAADMVMKTGHPAIKLQLDTGAISINQEDADQILGECWALVGHIHLSEPGLVPLGDDKTDHHRMAHYISRWLEGSLVTIEMAATKEEPHLAAVERAIRVANVNYKFK